MDLGKKHPINVRLSKAGRARVVEQCIELVYDSLKSHMGYTSSKLSGKSSLGTTAFQKRTIKEYAWTIFLLSQLY